MKKLIICALFASLGVSYVQAQQVVYVQSQPQPQTQQVVYVQPQPQPQKVVIVKDNPPPPPRPVIVPILNAIFDDHHRGDPRRGGNRHNDKRR